VNFNKWVLETKPRKVARALEVDPAAVSNWQKRKSCPRPETMKRICQMSNGQISYDDIISYYLRGKKISKPKKV